MKIGNRFGQKLRYGSTSVALTAAVLVAVILLNVAVSALCVGRRWLIDMTPDALYTLTDDAERLLGETIESANETRDEDDPVEVDIIFCADPDVICENELLRYVYYTALDMQKAYPDTIKVSTRDVWENPSSVDEFRANAHSAIYQSNVIVSSGSEFRVYTTKSFFVTDENLANEIWAYNGEKVLVKGIMAVTRVEAPICALTTNHGEPFATEEGRAEYSEFLTLLENAGYDVVYLDLSREEIPENCRLIITFDPTSDFASSFDGAEVDELSKLSGFLDKAYSFMFFADEDTPKLINLEEYLEAWGIKLLREGDANYEVIDPENRLDGEGSTIVAQYQSGGMVDSFTEDMREVGGEPKVIFRDAIGMAYSDTYTKAYYVPEANSGDEAFTYGYYNKNGNSRSIFDIFKTGDAAFAYAKQLASGDRLENADGTLWKNASAPFGLMTVTRQMRDVQEGMLGSLEYLNSYVCAFGSTEFASNEILSGNTYGNADVLLATLRVIGREVEPVGLEFKPFYDDAISSNHYSPSAPTVWSVVLILLPAVVLTASGIVILVRRRTRS